MFFLKKINVFIYLGVTGTALSKVRSFVLHIVATGFADDDDTCCYDFADTGNAHGSFYMYVYVCTVFTEAKGDSLTNRMRITCLYLNLEVFLL